MTAHEKLLQLILTSPVAAIAAAVFVFGVLWMAYALLPHSGRSWATFLTRPITLEQKRALCTAFAVNQIGAALFGVALIDFSQGLFPANWIGVSMMLMFLGSALGFLRLRFRLEA